jgi:hypothetical protein
MIRTAIWGALVGATLLTACAEQQYCENDGQCLARERCEPTTHRCIDNPCFGQPADHFVRCDDGEAVMCDAAGRPVGRPCGALGCDPAQGGCRPCAPETLACYGDALVLCGEAGEVLDAQVCDYGCDDAAGECHACLPSTLACQGSELVRCDGDGRVVTREACVHGCDAGRGGLR